MSPQQQHHVYIWEYRVVPNKREEFMRAYGPNGAWVALFTRASGYIDTLLLNDQTDPARFLTIDRWCNADAHNAFITRYRAEYDELDRFCESFTSHEASLGSYWQCSSPPAA